MSRSLAGGQATATKGGSLRMGGLSEEEVAELEAYHSSSGFGVSGLSSNPKAALTTLKALCFGSFENATLQSPGNKVSTSFFSLFSCPMYFHVYSQGP